MGQPKSTPEQIEVKKNQDKTYFCRYYQEHKVELKEKSRVNYLNKKIN